MQGFEDVEVLIVDNGSVDGTFEAMKALIRSSGIANAGCVLEPVHGSNIARNRGVRESKGLNIAILDDDAVPLEGWVAKYRQHFLEKRSEVVAGRVDLRLEAEWPNWLPKYMGWILGKTEYGDQSKFLETGIYAQSNNCAFTRNVFDTLGGFNPDSLIYGDETEFFRRAEAANFRTFYAHDIVVDHCVPPSRLSREGLLNKARLWGRGFAYYWRLNAPGPIRKYLRILEFMARVAYLKGIITVAPTFPREYTLAFNRGHLEQLRKV